MVSPRIDQLRRLVAFSVEEGLILSVGTDIRWATGFSGSSGALLLTVNAQHLFTDGRYTTQSAQEAPSCTIHIEQGNPVVNAALFASSLGINRVQLQLDAVSQERYASLASEHHTLTFEASRVDMARLRAVKDEHELSSIAAALDITEKTFETVLPLIREGMTETELAAEIDYRQRLFGAERSSFETIAAFGSHTELPHARPGNRVLQRGEPILLDFGCVVNGYASDMTRMVYFGTPTADFMESYSLVRQALIHASDAARSGLTGRELDAVARSLFAKNGVDTHFSHSLGHGVGLDIHEWPSVSQRNTDLLPEGCIITIEPGLYIPNQFGIRIENMVQLGPRGAKTLNRLTTELQVL